MLREADSFAIYYQNPTIHALIAGFLKMGKILEECVKLEDMEEIGLVVENITYFGNQP
jgi:NAD+ diphosphatase